MGLRFSIIARCPRWIRLGARSRRRRRSTRLGIFIFISIHDDVLDIDRCFGTKGWALVVG
jgi:hypothetical protein